MEHEGLRRAVRRARCAHSAAAAIPPSGRHRQPRATARPPERDHGPDAARAMNDLELGLGRRRLGSSAHRAWHLAGVCREDTGRCSRHARARWRRAGRAGAMSSGATARWSTGHVAMRTAMVMMPGWHTGVPRCGGRCAAAGRLPRGHRMARVLRLYHRVCRGIVRWTVSVRARGGGAHRRELHNEQWRDHRR